MLFSFILFAQAQQPTLLQLLGFSFFVSIIGGMLLKLVIRWICKVEISNLFAFVQFLLFVWVLLLAVWIGKQIVPAAPPRLVSCVAIPLSIVLASIWYGISFKNQQGTPIGIVKGIIVTVITAVIFPATVVAVLAIISIIAIIMFALT